EYDLFGRGGAEIMAQTMGLPYLGSLPIHVHLRQNGDEGTPLKNWDAPAMGKSLDALCQQVASQISIAALSGKVDRPTLTIS
ncbi:MAG: sodium:proton antiporter, partial [Planctomycetes bacterium]|nr:sodium:proton antiporter [Planctomycetota bacterium]